MTGPYTISIGEPYPLGATVQQDGVNFSLFSKNATSVELLLFHRFDDDRPVQVLRLHPYKNKTFHYWHILVHGVGEGQIYAYRVEGPYDIGRGHRFNGSKVLIDPYSKGVVYGRNWSRDEARSPYANVQSAMKSLVVDIEKYDWEGVHSPNHHLSETIIYEMHVRGFTRHPSSSVKYPGTFDGIVEKIPYLKDLGVTTVELLPVHQFDTREYQNINPETGEVLSNYWGYNSICFFAPNRGYYTADWEEMEYLTGFRDLVKALHREGIEVILDVVFNHTGEGDENGPAISFRGIENSVYYLLDPIDKRYLNFSGCGNTVNCNHPLVRRLILESLRYWVEKMHVDGFRFDLASVLSRDENGLPMKDPPLLWEIESDPVLQKAKIIAEAWDAAGLYQVGGFPGERWAEWNGKYRDDVRRFLRGDPGVVGEFASRLAGSADLYQPLHREPYQSINFITCHDGFTLYDLVSYNQKHNIANGEDNRDGASENFSFNYGEEGSSDDPELERLRRRQIKNFATILFLSQGTPMMLAGDEICRSQGGNNNAYCQDNEISWIDWTLLQREKEMFRFWKELIAFRKAHPSLRRRDYYWGEQNELGWHELSWHGVRLWQPDWGHHSHSIALTIAGFDRDNDIHLIVNAWTGELEFQIPPLVSKKWFRSIDTALHSPEDIVCPGKESHLVDRMYRASPRSVVVLISKKEI